MTNQRLASMAASVLLAVTGGPLAADAQPGLAPRGTAPTVHVAHIYYNIATGEKIAVPLGDVRPADDSNPEVWIADNTIPCAGFGGFSSSAGVIDSPNCSTCLDSTATGMVYLDWGDIGPDSVIDCIGVNWATDHQDSDGDGDGVGDGVEGFGATWTWYDGENGFDSAATRVPVVSVTLFDLPGRTFPGLGPRYNIPIYSATIDLAGSFTSSLVFELGDTDSIDGSGAGNSNPGSGVDLDADGLSDFGYSVRFIQPGTADFDGDGVPDGDPSEAATTGWRIATARGQTRVGPGNVWTIDFDPPPNAQGTEDAFDILYEPDGAGQFVSFGTFWYGGFTCDDDGDGDFGDTSFYAQFAIEMYGPPQGGVCCPADIFPVSPPGGAVCDNGDGALNFFDVAAFLDWLSNQDPRGDLHPAFGDGSVDFFDLIAFLNLYNAGCP